MSIDNTRVSVDDADPQIQWNGPWFTTEDIVDDLGNGTPFLNTLHGISSNGSLTFSYYGTAVGVWGSLRPRNTTSGRDPNWRCLLDGNEIGAPWDYPNRPYSNYYFCRGTAPEGNHTLQFNAIVQSETLYVDQVQYQAAATADIGGAWTEVRNDDGRFSYSPGWTSDNNGYWKWTYTAGAWLTYDFNGTGVVWGGYTPRNSGVGPGMGQYKIDDEEPKDFAIPSPSITRNNQAYFNITGLTPGLHRLTVTNTGNEGTAALGLTYVYTKNGAKTTPKRTSAKVIGGAVGGSIGAVLLAVLAALAILRYRRRKLQREGDTLSMGGTTLSSTIREQRSTPGSPIWGQQPGYFSHQPSIIASNGAHNPSTFVPPLGPYQATTFVPPPGPAPTTFVPPPGPTPTTFAAHHGPNKPTMFVIPSNPSLRRGTSYVPASSGMQPPASFAVASSSLQPGVSFTPAPGDSRPTSFSDLTGPAAPQNAWPTPMPTPIQHVQDGKADVVEYNPYQ
ncbi:hypothetical protein EST38_g12144 [Candolleomyces aberdarensis]|uniref:Transmembrane protein n=1 Tax=Candolleomyces aberdarensis TaxID=2316362 RepID=A0A4Q2D355_9AGAR|nr:hypothetical protein EST38_g12144 [Candolleomyces aberdarensis]